MLKRGYPCADTSLAIWISSGIWAVVMKWSEAGSNISPSPPIPGRSGTRHLMWSVARHYTGSSLTSIDQCPDWQGKASESTPSPWSIALLGAILQLWERQQARLKKNMTGSEWAHFSFASWTGGKYIKLAVWAGWVENTFIFSILPWIK